MYLVQRVDIEPDCCEVTLKSSRLRAWMGRGSGGTSRRFLHRLARLACLLALAASPALAGGGAVAGNLGPGDEPLRKWEPDAAAQESARKITFFEKLTRWAQEPTANQVAMDARYYDLDLEIDPDLQQISGTLTARLRVSAAQCAQVDLDLATGLSVSGVTLGGSAAGYTHANDLLSITLDRTYSQGEEVEVAVSYSGTPPGSYGAFGFDTYDGQPMIWTLSEPFGARSWWPCDDWSDDKADSMDLEISVPAGLIVASNGTLREVVNAGERDIYRWHEGYPISTYLVSLAIHPYTVSSDYYVSAADDSLEIRFFMFPDHAAEYAEVNALTAEMVACYAGLFGEYPFMGEKYGHAEFLWGGGMEHQTCTSLGAFYESIIAHELSHQWWGDMVTCGDFHHIWLNEGFARYSEALWQEHAYGTAAYRSMLDAIRYYGSGTIYVPDLSDMSRIFDTGLTYNKAGWVVHMLRGVLGDEDFFACLLAWRAAFAYGAATTEDFQAIAEGVSGLDLDDFFQQWIYGEYYPVYQYAWENAAGPGGDELHLAIDQVQTNTGLFHMPVRIRVLLAGGGTQDFVVDNAQAHEEYVLALSAPAEGVELDPENWILKRALDAVEDPTFTSGVLLVNGIDWNTYGTELTSAYEDRAFWGTLEISFWDYFTKADAYPATLPEPLGHGRVPASVLEDYLAVIWVGNNYNGDLNGWLETSIPSYLQAGGNVLLMTRMGEDFLDASLRDYLGIEVRGTDQTLYDCVANDARLVNIPRLGTQSYNMYFDRTLTQPTSQLLFDARLNYNPDVGIGVIRVPEGGGSHNPKGGQFAFLSGRPYRWNHAALATDVVAIIGWIQAAWAATPEGVEAASEPRLLLPGLARDGAEVRFFLPGAGGVQLDIYDVQGRLVRELLHGPQAAGEHALTWNGRADSGVRLASGVYFVRLDLPRERTLRGRIVLAR